jgi:TonB family protein
MNTLYYFVQANINLIVFFAFYWLLLRNETFHQNNRLFLMLGCVLAFLLPLFNSNMVQAWFITQKTTDIFTNLNTITVKATTTNTNSNMSVVVALFWLYVLGCVVFMVRFFANSYNLIRVLQYNTAGHKAFSFFNNIYVDSEHDPDNVIYLHEQVHARQMHSLDLLVLEIIGIFCWFNPIIYAYKIALRNIHEFIADDIASKELPSKADYAMLLFSEQFQTHPSVLVNNFFTKTSLKIRIEMLSKIKSKKMALLKYGLSIPAFLIMLVVATANIKAAKVANILSYNASHITLKGKLLNEQNKPIVGATVILAHTNLGTTSDRDGLFEITIPKNGQIVLSHINYKTLILNNIGQYYGKLAILKMTEFIHTIDGNVLVTYSPKLQADLNHAQQQSQQLILPPGTDSIQKVDKGKVYTVVEKQAEFSGGTKAMYAYLLKNLNYPETAKKAKASGKVFVSFLVQVNGSITDIEVKKGIGYGLDEEAVRVVKAMPNWQPATQSGEPVVSKFTMPLYFLLE